MYRTFVSTFPMNNTITFIESMNQWMNELISKIPYIFEVLHKILYMENRVNLQGHVLFIQRKNFATKTIHLTST